MADLQATIGETLRQVREERSRTLKSIAAEAGISVVYLGEIERGKKYPSAPVLERLATALGLELADLLELVADALRVEAPAQMDAIGFALSARGAATPRVTVKRLAGMLPPEEVTTMAELGAFFLARHRGPKE
jgi:transcriptional regulator with XRE-family HTH domain